MAGAALAAKVDAADINTESLFAKLKSFMEPDGNFKSNMFDKSSASKANTHLALQVLEAYASGTKSESLAEFGDAVFNLLPQGDDEAAVDPTVLCYLGKISAKKPRLQSSHLLVIMESILQLRHSSSLTNIASVIESLTFAKTYKAQPMYFGLSRPAIDIDDVSKSITIEIFDVFGKPVPADKIAVDAVKRVGRDTIIHQGEGAVVNLSATTLEVGRHVMDLLITLAGRTKPLVARKEFVVKGKVSVKSVYAGVTTSAKAERSSLTAVGKQNGLEDVEAFAAAGDVLHVHFSVVASSQKMDKKRVAKPHQAFIKLTHIDSGLSTFLVAQASSGDVLNYQAAVVLTKEASNFMHQSGRYTVSILVADAIYVEPFDWVVGTFVLTFPTKVPKKFPLYKKSLLHDSDNTLTTLPEIEHMMRPPALRASPTMAALFTALCLLPLGLFFLFVMWSKPNLKHLSGSSNSGKGFLLSVAAILLMYTGYWFGLPGFSFYDTIKYICFLAPVTVILGRSALIAVTTARIQTHVMAVGVEPKKEN